MDSQESFLEAYVRLDKTINDCEHCLTLAERMAAKGRPFPEAEITAVRVKMHNAMSERDRLDTVLKKIQG